MDKQQAQQELTQKHGVPQDHVQQLAALPNVNWQGVFNLLTKYGPGIISDLLQAFGGSGSSGSTPAVVSSGSTAQQTPGNAQH